MVLKLKLKKKEHLPQFQFASGNILLWENSSLYCGERMVFSRKIRLFVGKVISSSGALLKFTVNFCLQLVPMVPISGDIPIALVSYVKQSPHYNASHWSCASEQAELKASATHFTCSKIDMIRSEHLRFISELSRASSVVSCVVLTFGWMLSKISWFQFKWHCLLFSEVIKDYQVHNYS